ncbi:amino acid adenylation domain-containing protein [Roseateles sp. SL47]|uniref:non-ribosomal peptide synthetase n=1 Tax=Roseateles sp. SL47 TaxID=2995138 RepID=UPI00226E713B|nr:non-ribosomal peptide synthetase [Roseateles sp. SL47]WAC73177.1 amino acid adenylation domain-containing protein [Roseateles sp. SL47]
MIDFAEFGDLVGMLKALAQHEPDADASAFFQDLENGSLRISHAALYGRVCAMGGALREAQAVGKVAVLLEPGVDFLSALLGCLQAGVTPVVAWVPQDPLSLERLQVLLTGGDVGHAITCREFHGRMASWRVPQRSMPVFRWYLVDAPDGQTALSHGRGNLPEAACSSEDAAACRARCAALMGALWRAVATASSAERCLIQALGFETFPLSSAQQVIWFDQMLDPQLPCYNIGMAWQMDGPIDPQVLQQAVQCLADAHEALRLLFLEEDGQARQMVLPQVDVALPLVDFSSSTDAEAQARSYMQSSFSQPFSLRGGLLWSTQLIRVSPTKHFWLQRYHHLVTDGVGISLIVQSVARLYNAFLQGDVLEEPASSYRAFVADDERYLRSERHALDGQYWRGRYGRLPDPLVQRPSTDAQGQLAPSAQAHWVLSREEHDRLQAYAAEQGATFTHVFLAALAAYFAWVTPNEEVVIGLPVHNRSAARHKHTPGMFSSVSPIGLHVDGARSFPALVRELVAELRRSYRHQRYPLADINRSIHLAPTGRRQLFDVMVSTMYFDGDASFGGVPARVVPMHSGFERTPLLINLRDHHRDGDVVVEFIYNTLAFDPEEIERIPRSLAVMLQSAVQHPETPVGHLPFLDATEQIRLLEDFNATAVRYEEGELVQERFEAQVRMQPQAVAVEDDTQVLSYAELNERANRVAHRLLALGIEPDDRVAICMSRGVEMVVGVLGILKSGAAYVPLDPAYPAARLAYMLSDCEPAVVLTEQALVSAVREVTPTGVALLVPDGEDGALLQAQPVVDPDTRRRHGLHSRHLAYIIYTSGSTGQPKGVQIEHRSVVNFLSAMTGLLRVSSEDAVLAVTTLSFDIAGLELYLPLINGARMVLVSRETASDASLLEQALERSGVTLMQATPVTWRMLLDNGWTGRAGLRMLCGGEALSGPLAQRLSGKGAQLWNLYGPTETTVWSTACCIDPVQAGVQAVQHIGRPIANTRIYILDGQGRPVPIGVVGEIHIGGHGVARGYWKRPDLTQQRFVEDGFSGEAGARLYKTGDLGRWLADGDIEYLGRNDHQVKIRGFRIELGEIEARLVQCPGVREAVVVAREDQGGDKRLVAYVSAQEGAQGEALAVSALRSRLAEALADYMVPSAFVVLAGLPLTPNGKIDRQALPAPEAGALVSQPYEAPADPLEQRLAQIWQELLGVERVGRHDNFFELGGHSLLAVRVIVRVRQELGVESSLRALFNQPELAAFAKSVEQAGASLGQHLGQRITPADRSAALPVSYAQQRLWFLDRLDAAAGAAYHMPVALRLSGALQRQALKATLDGLVRRHEILRTRFGSVDGQTVQWIDGPEVGFQWQEVDLSGLEEPQRTQAVQSLSQEEQRAPFDLARGPLIRGQLLKLEEQAHILLLTQHHIISDGWSTGIMVREVSALYEAYSQGREDPLEPLTIQYADYAVWQRQWLQGEVLRQQTQYWKEQLGGAPALLELPTDRPRPVEQSYEGGQWRFEIPAQVSAGLQGLAQSQGATLFMTLLAGWAVLLSRLSGQKDIVVGTPVANRQRSEVEGLIGFFVNTLALRVRLEDDPTVQELLQQVKASTLDAYEHQDLPFEQVVEALQPQRSLSHSPLFQNMLSLNNTPVQGPLQLSGLSISTLAPDSGSTQFDLSLALSETPEGLSATLSYASALYEPSSIQRLEGYLQAVLRGLVEDPTQRVSELALLSAAQRRQVLEEFNATARAYPQDELIHELFEEQVRARPQATALVYEQQQLSYGELNERANQVAHRLVQLGIRPDDRVAICMQRSVEMVVGLLGILKSGAAYVPLDPAYPAARLAYMLGDSEPGAVLTQQALVQEMRQGVAIGVPVLALDGAEAAQIEVQPRHDPDPQALGLNARHLAYIIYTSGSTGQPKGVMVEHAGVVNRLRWMQEALDLRADEAVLQKTPFGFDVSVWEFFWPLMLGARLVMARPEGHKDPAYLSAVIRHTGVTTVHFVPSMLQQFLAYEGAASCTGLRRVVCSGEELPAALARELLTTLPGTGLHNLYGPTEASVDVTAWTCSLDDHRTFVPIGRPIANTAIYILDPQGQPTPLGVSGELHIAGVQVARGYWNRAELTQQRFVPDPHSGQAAARLYKTGDLARWLPDGSIEYLGRNDHQVKIRGFRIELGEIEARLAQCLGVREAVVLARSSSSEDKRLVAYLTPHAGHELLVGELRTQLRSQLPDYMVPSAFVVLDAFPLTPNGKLDRQALPDPDDGSVAMQAYEVPVGPVECAIAGIWQELLGMQRIGRHDNFFDLGGHSLLAVQMASRLRSELQVDVPLRQLFDQGGLKDLADWVAAAAPAPHAPLVPVDRQQELALSLAQQRLWFLDQFDVSASVAYHMLGSWRIHGPLDRIVLKKTLDALVDRHEILRTSFPAWDGRPFARIAAPGCGFSLIEQDLSDDGPEDQQSRISAQANHEAGAAFDLAQGPLIRGQLLRLSASDHVLLVTQHHIISDGWSLRLLMKEVSALYDAFSRGEADPLPLPEIQYLDYAAWQRAWLQEDLQQRQIGYWKDRLADAPALLELPTDRPRPAVQTHAGAAIRLALDKELTGALKRLAAQHGATLFMTLLAGWAALLSRLSGQHEVVIGMPVANRRRRELESMVGFFVNTLALRVHADPGVSVAGLLSDVRRHTLDAYAHQDVPFEQVVEAVRPARSLGHHPLFQAMLALDNVPGAPQLHLGGLDVRWLEQSQTTARCDLCLLLSEVDGGLTGVLEYASDLFDPATIQGLAERYQRLLQAMVAGEATLIGDLPLMSDHERSRVLEGFNDTTRPYPSDRLISELFEEQARRSPQAVALVSGAEQLSYAALNEQSNRLAWHLRSMGVGPDVTVAVCMERTPDVVVAFLAVLKAGGAYVPLDPSYPVHRLDYMLSDSAPQVLITQESLLCRFPDTAVPTVVLDVAHRDRHFFHLPKENLDTSASGCTARHLAYVMYTSGSTGQPKGVMVDHRGVVRLVCGTNYITLTPDDIVAQASNISFDAATFEIWGALLSGARLTLIDRWTVVESTRLAAEVRRQGISVLFLTTALFHQVARESVEAFKPLRCLLVGGDKMEARWAEKALREGRPGELLNAYGPTETVTFAAWHSVGASVGHGNVPIGRPIANTRIYILDGQGRPVPIGVVGEIHIGGHGVARGYWKRPDLTQQRFVEDGFSGEAGARLYKTGDLGRWLADGDIEYLGRNDHQVKIRGFRIELGEIEARLVQCPGVREAVVVAREDQGGDKRLVAYVSAQEGAQGEALAVSALRSRLAEALADYMVPSAFVVLAGLPLTPNGKIDRQALPARRPVRW